MLAGLSSLMNRSFGQMPQPVLSINFCYLVSFLLYYICNMLRRWRTVSMCC
uniref:Uncharacterized protein n=1 Tax=Arundo donax TaxID=35708 RepID=A0A0A9AY86_ARUDO